MRACIRMGDFRDHSRELATTALILRSQTSVLGTFVFYWQNAEHQTLHSPQLEHYKLLLGKRLSLLVLITGSH